MFLKMKQEKRKQLNVMTITIEPKKYTVVKSLL